MERYAGLFRSYGFEGEKYKIFFDFLVDGVNLVLRVDVPVFERFRTGYLDVFCCTHECSVLGVFLLFFFVLGALVEYIRLTINNLHGRS